MMMEKLLQLFYVTSVGICVQIVIDSCTFIAEQSLTKDRWTSTIQEEKNF